MYAGFGNIVLGFEPELLDAFGVFVENAESAALLKAMEGEEAQQIEGVCGLYDLVHISLLI